jgi:hypothetical protein
VLIPVERLGERVFCRHCHAHFQARDPSTENYWRDTPQPTTMDRVNRLLPVAAPRQSASLSTDYFLHSE